MKSTVEQEEIRIKSQKLKLLSTSKILFRDLSACMKLMSFIETLNKRIFSLIAEEELKSLTLDSLAMTWKVHLLRICAVRHFTARQK